jgi:putative transposase
MAKPKRRQNIPGTYFATSRTWESRALFVTAPPCEVFVETLLHYRDQGAYLLHAFVLMPDHFHILLTPGHETTLERSVQFIKGGSAKRIRERLQFRFPIWQRGFSDHRIRDTSDFVTHSNYLARNPVKKRLVVEAGEYRWSSAGGVFRMDEIPGACPPVGGG